MSQSPPPSLHHHGAALNINDRQLFGNLFDPLYLVTSFVIASPKQKKKVTRFMFNDQSSSCFILSRHVALLIDLSQVITEFE